MALDLFFMLVFPGFLFLGIFALAMEFVDRRVYARVQHRQGPPWFQPLADLIKLSAKQDLLPAEADKTMYKFVPLVAMAAVVTAFFYIPIWGYNALLSFDGDLIVVIYLLSIPTMAIFLSGWYSRSVFSMIGAVRAITQVFAYEVPLMLALIAPAILADSWNLSKIAEFYDQTPWLAAINTVGFLVALVAVLGKMEKVPFDIPEAETEIVAGAFTEYSGRLLAMFRLALHMEAVVAAALLAAVFLPFGLGLPAPAAFGLFLLKVVLIVVILAVLRGLFARLRIDQMISFCWKIAAPIAFAQVVVCLVVKGLMH